MKTIIIDGNNLIHAVPEFKSRFIKDKENTRASVVEAVMTRVGKDYSVKFVFDGHGNTNKRNVIFSEDLTADDKIKKLIENFRVHKKLKVVSSDVAIAAFAKACGCEYQRSQDFWKEINSNSPSNKNINQNYIYDDIEKPDRLSKKEIDEFRKYFS